MVERNVILFKWRNFFTDLRFYGPIAIIYFQQVTGSYALGLAVFSIASIASTIFEVPTGIFSDRIGRKKTLVFGSFANLLAICFFAFAHSFFILIIGAIFEGLTISLFSGNNEALLYDTLNEQGKKNTFSDTLGKVSSLFQIGLAVAAFFGGFIASYSLRLTMILTIIPQIICLIITLFFVEPTIHGKEVSGNIFMHLKDAYRAFIQNSKLRKLSLASILSYGIGETNHQFQPAFFQLLWPMWALGIVRTLEHIFAFFSFYFAGNIIKKFTALKTLVSQQLFTRINAIVFVGIPNIVSPFMLSLNSLFFGVERVASQTLLHKEFTDEQRATMGSLNALVGSLFFALFSFLVGFVADMFGPMKALLLGEVLLLSVVYIYKNLFKHHQYD